MTTRYEVQMFNDMYETWDVIRDGNTDSLIDAVNCTTKARKRLGSDIKVRLVEITERTLDV
jgi:hypothetical protein